MKKKMTTREKTFWAVSIPVSGKVICLLLNMHWLEQCWLTYSA